MGLFLLPSDWIVKQDRVDQECLHQRVLDRVYSDVGVAIQQSRVLAPVVCKKSASVVIDSSVSSKSTPVLFWTTVSLKACLERNEPSVRLVPKPKRTHIPLSGESW